MIQFILLLLGALLLSCIAGSLAARAMTPILRVKATLPRLFLVVLAVALVSMAVHVGVLFLRTGSNTAESSSLQLIAIGMVVGILAIRAMLPTTFGKAAVLWFVAGAGQLVVALVLYLFFWQTWSIPTGSMAPTLAGFHFDVVCGNCGRAFVVEAPMFGPHASSMTARCANCRAETVIKLPPANPLAFDPQMNGARPIIPGAQPGDHILGLKTRLPRRWELAVFRAPHHPESYYVARVAGLPGEVIEIAEGDVFINGMRAARPADRFDSMWLLVSDTSFIPKQPDKTEPGWRAAKEGSSWKQQPGAWSVDAGAAAELLFDRAIVDEIEYFSHRGALGLSPRSVRDVRLDVEIQSLTGTGSGDLVLTWSYDNREVTARFTAKGTAWLEFSDQISESAADGLNWTAGHTVGLAVRDGIASLLIDGRVVVTRQVGSQKIEDHRQERDPEKPVPARLSVTAEKINVTLSRLVVRRDVYYLGDVNIGFGCNGCTGKPFTLGAAEYFVLGDNSPFSRDSRLWDTVDPSLAGRVQVGAVPEDSIKAVAHWVYWPLGRARAVE